MIYLFLKLYILIFYSSICILSNAQQRYIWTKVLENLIRKHIGNKSGGIKSFLCPATQATNTLSTGILSYPLDIFDKISDDIQTFNCSSTELPTQFHQCTLGGEICPVHTENVRAMLGPINWKMNNGVCEIFNKKKEVSNIYIIGGSVTKSHGTQGCCCDLDNSCPKHDETSFNCYHFEPKESSFDAECGWVTYFSRFIQSRYPSLKVTNIAKSGTTSAFAAATPYFSLQYEVSRGDILFLDYSVNDQSVLGRELSSILYGIEGITRYFLSKGASVIILESFPYGELDISDNLTYYRPNDKFLDYSSIYREIAKYYNVPIWSYRDSVWDKYVDLHQQQFADYIRWDISHIDASNPEHPHWFAHIFQADLYSAAWQVHEEYCKEHHHIQSEHNNISFQLPKPLSFTNKLECSEHSQDRLFLDASVEYEKLRHQSLLEPDFKMDLSRLFNKVVNTSSSFSQGWFLIEDREEKPGFISDSENSVIYIPFEKNEYSNIILHLAFLKTYLNAGIIDIYVCDDLIGTVDSLWPSEFSILQTVKFTICSSNCTYVTNPGVKIIHKNSNNQLVRRGKQKFKLTFISLCQLAEFGVCEENSTNNVYFLG